MTTEVLSAGEPADGEPPEPPVLSGTLGAGVMVGRLGDPPSEGLPVGAGSDGMLAVAGQTVVYAGTVTVTTFVVASEAGQSLTV